MLVDRSIQETTADFSRFRQRAFLPLLAYVLPATLLLGIAKDSLAAGFGQRDTGHEGSLVVHPAAKLLRKHGKVSISLFAAERLVFEFSRWRHTFDLFAKTEKRSVGHAVSWTCEKQSLTSMVMTRGPEGRNALYVSPGHRGRGLARTMMSFLLQIARQEKIDQFVIREWDEGVGPFYVGLGFVPAPHAPDDLLFPLSDVLRAPGGGPPFPSLLIDGQSEFGQ